MLLLILGGQAVLFAIGWLLGGMSGGVWMVAAGSLIVLINHWLMCPDAYEPWSSRLRHGAVIVVDWATQHAKTLVILGAGASVAAYLLGVAEVLLLSLPCLLLGLIGCIGEKPRERLWTRSVDPRGRECFTCCNCLRMFRSRRRHDCSVQRGPWAHDWTADDHGGFVCARCGGRAPDRPRPDTFDPCPGPPGN
jgi:hypothetical protein